MTSNFFVSRTISSYLLFSSFFFMRALHLSALFQIELAQSGGTSWCPTHHLVLSWQVLVQPGPRTRRVVQVSVPLMCFYVSLIYVVFHTAVTLIKLASIESCSTAAVVTIRWCGGHVTDIVGAFIKVPPSAFLFPSMRIFRTNHALTYKKTLIKWYSHFSGCVCFWSFSL